MKKTIVLSLLSLAAMNVAAQDVIVKKDGSTIVSKVIEVSETQVTYKKFSNIDGPTYTISTSELSSINYPNGEKDSFNNTSLQKKEVERDTDNEEKIAEFARLPRLNLKQSNKKSKDYFPIMAFSSSSIISTKELLILMDPTPVEYYDGGWKVKLGYAIKIVNKTNKPIYIDRANCFRRYNDFEMKSYFDNKQVTVSHGNGNSAGIGVGIGSLGIGVSGSSSSTYSDSYGVDRFLVIGPLSSANLIDYQYIRLSENKAKFRTVSDIEYWGFTMNNFSINQGEVKTYTENTTPYSNRYYITYSTDQEFRNTYNFEFELYAKYIVGAKMKPWRWSSLQPEARLISEIKKIVPDFWTNSVSIIGMPVTID